jgi:predicted Zn-dependent protease
VFGVWRFAFLLLFSGAVHAQESTNGFAFGDFLLAPLRVHLLTATNEPAIHTTLTVKDTDRILGKVNRIWAQAGITFYLESLRVEAAVNTSNYVENAREDERATLLALRPKDSLATNCFHVFYLKQIRPNGIYFNAQGIFVKETANLRKVEGGLDEPIPRVTAHELGHALTLPHRQYITNLMSSGNNGTWLNEAEIKQTREAAGIFPWVQSAPEVLRKADALKSARKSAEARELFLWLQHIPLDSRERESVLRQLAGPKK